VLFRSNPRSDNEEGWKRGRHGTFHDWDAWQRYMSTAGFLELNHHIVRAGYLATGSRGWRASGTSRLEESRTTGDLRHFAHLYGKRIKGVIVPASAHCPDLRPQA
jgi:hypothetical protein